MMKLGGLILLAALAIAPVSALAQANKYPPPVFNRGVTMANLCKSMGGRVVNGAKPFLYNSYDVNGDGILDWLLDAGSFACAGKPDLYKSPTGSTFEVFISDGRGGATSAYIGTVQSFRIVEGKPAKLFITTASASEKQLTWNASSKKMIAGAPQAGAQTAASASPFTGPAFTVMEVDKTAALRAAGFKKVGSQWKSDCDDPGTPSYTPGQTEVQDLNGDGRPEIWVTEGGTYCYGNTGQHFWLMAKDSSGKWVTMLDETGIQVVQKGKRYGWPDIQVGGPGMGPFPVFRFDGRKYAFTR